MRKLLTFALGLVVSAMTSYALPYVCFYTTSGGDTPVAVASEGLVITVEGDNLIATPGQGEALTLPLNTLQGMEFSWSATGIENLLDDGATSFALYGLDGLKAGSFSSLDDASKALPQGVYIVKKNNGKTVKILLGK